MFKLTIITINRNNAEGLRKTMESVFAQTCKEFEYIVVDGASDDESVDIIRDYSRRFEIGDLRLENFKWISEPDNGIYEAMNKGLKMAKGEYTLMLNSGDFFVDEYVIEKMMPELHTEDMIQGNLIIDYATQTVRYRGYGRSDISFVDAMEANFPHQATFIRLSTMKEYGYYDETYKRSSDAIFFITTLAFGNASFRYVDLDVANFDPNGLSSVNNPENGRVSREEKERWQQEHVSNRLCEHCAEAAQAIGLYHTLQQHSWIMRIVKLLAKVSRRLSPPQPYVKMEIIK